MTKDVMGLTRRYNRVLGALTCAELQADHTGIAQKQAEGGLEDSVKLTGACDKTLM